MPNRKAPFFISLGGLLLLLAGVSLWFLLLPQPVAAQCGSQASSCKNCHEVQAQDPVNNDGTGWHESHAFGDFCYLCHAGNPQATDIEAAHTGLVPPLADVKAACQQCHAADLNERAQVYAVALGVEIGGGESGSDQVSTTSAPPSSNSPAAEAQPTASAPTLNTELSPVEIAFDDPNLVDYAQRYDEIVLGKYPTNWGDLVLVGLIGLIAVGGGGFVLFNENRRRQAALALTPVAGEYPADVVELLPALAELKPPTRQSLKKLLKHPNKTDQVLGLVDTLIADDKGEE